MNCQKYNFSQKEFSRKITALMNISEIKTSDELITHFIQGLEDIESFSTNIKTSENVDRYEISVDELINTILVKLDEVNLPIEKFGTREEIKSKLKEALSDYLLPNSQEIVKEETQAVIPDAGLISEQERKSKTYKDLMNVFFQDLPALKSRRSEIISTKLLLSTIINTALDQSMVISSNKDLNENLENFKKEEYLVIKKYLQKLGYTGYATGLYTEHLLNSNSYNKLMKDIYQVIQDKINNSSSELSFKEELKEGWLNSLLNKQTSEPTLYDVVNAYLNLMYFDKVIENSLGKYIKIDETLLEPITIVTDQFNKKSKKYKYSFNSGNAETVKGWETAETRDAIKEMGKFSKLVIESIPFYKFNVSSRTDERLSLNLNAVRFSNSITKLIDALNSLKIKSDLGKTEQELIKLVNTLHFKSEESFPKILNQLFVGDTKHLSALHRKLKKLGLNDFDINVLYSIRKTLYANVGKKSYNQVEQDFYSEHGFVTSRYPIIQSILGVVDSTVSMNYLQSKYNYGTQEQELSVKLKFPTDRNVYDVVTNVNNSTANNKNKKQILNTYKLTQQDTRYVINVDGVEFTILPTRGGVGVLSKSNKETQQANISNLSYLINFDQIDVTSATGRTQLLQENRNENQDKFMKLLSFIDQMLSTSFSKDSDGLILFNIYNQLDKHGFENLLLAASRALIVTHIYNDFEQNRTSHNLTELQLENYLKIKDVNERLYPYLNFEKLDSSDRRQLFKNSGLGEQLAVIVESEQWLHNLSHAHAIITGDVSKAVIKNLDNDSIPNFSPAFEGAFVKKRSYEAKQEFGKTGDAASAYLLFSEHADAIKTTVIDTDVLLQNGKKVQVKNMTKTELLLHALEKFFISAQQSDGKVIIQPTSYSDKVKLVNYEVSKVVNNVDLTTASTEILENLMIDTLGKFFKQVWNNVLYDYEAIFGTKDVLEISKKLKELTVEELVNLGNIHGVEIHTDLHFRKIEGKLYMNELLNQFANHTYNNLNELRKRLDIEKIKFAESFIKNRVHINLTYNEKEELIKDNGITSAVLSKFPSISQQKEWISGKKLIIGKIVDLNGKVIQDVKYGKQIVLEEGQKFILNPVLETFFMAHSLMGNNLRFLLSGSELNHKIKSLGKKNLSKNFIDNASILNKYGITNLSTASLIEIDQAILKMENDNISEGTILRNKYDDIIYNLESQGQIAQIKRNVIIPATLRYYLQDTLNGITKNQNVAVVEDISAFVFNFDGIRSIIDAHDGSALEDPFTSRLENLSLQDNEVGTVKKPIWHHYNHRYGTAYLAKYAVDTITNQWMRQSELSDISLKTLFRKMTNKQWSQRWDLMNSAQHKLTSKLNFERDILEQKPLFYKKGDKHYRILDFNKDEFGNWYTEETEVSKLGSILDAKNKIKVYHYFDNQGNHYTSASGVDEHGNPYISSEENVKIELHTINSLYELHTAMGGIWCESLTEDNGLQYSEASVYAVVNFMNNVTIHKGKDIVNDAKTQAYYYQPLKHGYISYVANNSAIKNGAANINSSKVYTDETSELSYMSVTTEGHGIQMDADHTSDEAQMTEFSQVISSLDAGGRLHDYVKQIYQVLGQVAIEQAQIELHALKEFKKSGDVSSVYDIVGRTIINNLASKRGQAGLAESIINTIKKQFNLNSDHSLDSFKIPFSDSNIYSNILSTFVSIINNKSIKRKYPGQGTVMVPGYGMSQIWEIDGKPYQYEDLLKEALNKLENVKQYDNIVDVSTYNKTIIREYLKQKQNEVPVQPSLNSFQPTENVLVNLTGERFMLENINTNEVDYEIVEKSWKTDATQSNTTIRFYIKGHKEFGYFELVKDHELGYYSVHFKTGDAETKQMLGSTPEQREVLYKNLYAAIPEGAYVSTQGNVSIGGEYALKKLMKNCEVVGERTVGDIVGRPIKINIYQKPGEFKLEHELNVSLYNIDDYYEFKINTDDYLKNKGYLNISNRYYRKNISKARDLAPAKISFKYLNENNEEIETNIFDTPPLVEAYAKKLKRSDPNIQKSVQEVLDGIEQNKYYHENGNLIDENGKTYFKITSITNVPAELIMSNIYKTKFGIKEGQSLRDVLDSSTSFMKQPTIVNSSFWDLVFTKGNGEHLYITFNNITAKAFVRDHNRLDWKFINRTKYTLDRNLVYNPIEKTVSDCPEIINRIYATNKDNIKLFEVGRDIIRKDVIYDKEKGKFVDLQKNVLKNQKQFRRVGEDKVAEYIEFVHRNEIIENGQKHVVYNIDKHNLFKVFSVNDNISAEEEVNKYISGLLADIYKSQNHSGIQIQSTLKRRSALILESTIKGLGNHLSYDTNLKEHLFEIHDQLLAPALITSGGFGDFKLSSLKYNKLKRKYADNMKNKIRASFEKAQYFTASRIPAQTLQSFMQMKCVGFTGTATNQCFVSHWQTWLQGSDYDIDKAYIMGHNFDDNGVYIGWSDQFKYSSLEAIKASEQLPMPQGRRFRLSNNGIGLTELSYQFEQADDVNKIKILINVLEKISKAKADNGEILIKATNDNKLYQAIISHENTKLPQDLKLESFKNFISSHIETVIQNVRNMIGAYTPIDMEILRDASIYHSNKEVSKNMTLLNPNAIYEMQYASMVGKKVIGIAATGEKASFMWHYWLNDIIRGNIKDFEKYGKFNHQLSRVHGRSLNNLESKIVNILPDTNFENVSELNKENFGYLTPIITVDGMISQTLSAATDNVKELILDKINAGSKLAKCHLYLITLGYNINDIVNFMTSDIVAYIDNLTESNIYEDYNISIDDAISIAKGTLPTYIERNFMNTSDYFEFSKVNKNWKNYLVEDMKLKNPFSSASKNYQNVQAFIDFLEELKIHRPSDINGQLTTDMKADIEDFEKILAGANEFSNFGRLLGLNQGLPTSKVDLRNLLERIKKIITDRETHLKIVDKSGLVNQEILNKFSGDQDFSEIAGKFDVVRFLDDPSYRQLAIEYQNAIKENIPIFKIMEDIPQFKSILDLLNMVQKFDNLISVKSKFFDKLVDEFKKNNLFIDDFIQKGLLSYIDDLMVLDFMENYKYSFPIVSGTISYDSYYREVKVGESIDLSTPQGMLSFKAIFENEVIPNLRNGQFWNGEKMITLPELENNKFVQGLIRTVDGQMSLYKADIDMLAKDSSASNINKFQDYVTGLKILSKKEYKINNVPLSDWFIIYNLIVNKNNYGSDRMTTLLQEFIQEGNSNFLTRYLNHIGKLDFSQNVTLRYNLQDALIATARTVQSVKGRKEPMLILNTENGPVLMQKEGFGYREIGGLVPEISDETPDEKLQRINRRLQHGSLRINYNSYIETIVKQINQFDSDTINVLNSLIKQGLLTITNNCE